MCEMSDWVSDGTRAMASMLCGGVRVAGDDWDGQGWTGHGDEPGHLEVGRFWQ